MLLHAAVRFHITSENDIIRCHGGSINCLVIDLEGCTLLVLVQSIGQIVDQISPRLRTLHSLTLQGSVNENIISQGSFQLILSHSIFRPVLTFILPIYSMLRAPVLSPMSSTRLVRKLEKHLYVRNIQQIINERMFVHLIVMSLVENNKFVYVLVRYEIWKIISARIIQRMIRETKDMKKLIWPCNKRIWRTYQNADVRRRRWKNYFVHPFCVSVAAENFLPSRCLEIDVSSGSITPAFRRHVTICLYSEPRSLVSLAVSSLQSRIFFRSVFL
jgi:hypothetical protein